jgi:hypothetical protein
LSGYVVFEGAPLYHILEDEDETACGAMVAAVATLSSGKPKVTASPPFGMTPCERCLKALGGLPKQSALSAAQAEGRIELGDWVQIAVGPQAGRVGRVAGVIRAKGAADSSAVFKVTFSDGGEAGHVGANLKKVNR